MKRESILKRFFIISLFAALIAGTAFGQGTGFNFQGRLNDSTNPTRGFCVLVFLLKIPITLITYLPIFLKSC